tara:strand:- start:754 stop:927 length:174 start_codon:yes stop_codon:yes gene_type:complete
MKTLIVILILLGVMLTVYMIKTAQPYSKQLEDEENDELLRKIKEYDNKKSQHRNSVR